MSEQLELPTPARPGWIYSDDGASATWHEPQTNREFPYLTDGVHVSVRRYLGTKPPGYQAECQSSRPDWSRRQFNACKQFPTMAEALAFAEAWIPQAREFANAITWPWPECECCGCKVEHARPLNVRQRCERCTEDRGLKCEKCRARRREKRAAGDAT